MCATRAFGICRQAGEGFLPYPGGDVGVIGFGNAAGNSGKGVAVAAERDGEADSIFKIAAFEEGNDSLRHGVLTGFVEVVMRADGVAGSVQVVAVFVADAAFDKGFVFAISRQEDGGGGRLCAFDTFGVVVGDGGGFFRVREGFCEGIAVPGDRRNAHRRAVAIAVIGLRIVAFQPCTEHPTAAAVVFAAPVAHVGGKVVFAAILQPFGHGDGADGVVGEDAGCGKKIKIGCAVVVEFKS